MDKYGSIDQNWYSSENQKHEREKATEALKQMKELEKQYLYSRHIAFNLNPDDYVSVESLEKNPYVI